MYYNTAGNWLAASLATAVMACLLSPSAMAASETKLYGCTVITEPGNYLLATDIVVDQTCPSSDIPEGFVGIQIAASDVHVNLGGHTIYGDPAGYGDGFARGLDTTGDVQVNVRVTNGSVDGLGAFGDGIYIQRVKGAKVTNVESRGNQRFGMGIVSCEACEVTASRFYENGNAGIQTVLSPRDIDEDGVIDGPVRIVNNDFIDNPNSNGLTIGVLPGPHEVIGNRFIGNGRGIGEFLAFIPAGHLIQSNRVEGNLFGGISISSVGGTTIRANHVLENGGDGIAVSSSGNLIQANQSNGNSSFDLADFTAECDNTWKANSFETDSEGDGARSGCIR